MSKFIAGQAASALVVARRMMPAALWLLGACAAYSAGEAGNSGRSDVGVLTATHIEEQYSTVSSLQEILVQHFPGLMAGRSTRPGQESITSDMGAPLFVVNGVPASDAGFALGLNPRDVQRVEVHRYGSATAAYGLRGSNGVVLITLK